MAVRNPIDILTQTLAQYLGPHAAANTVEGFCRRSAGVAPEAATAPQLVKALPHLQPLLSVLLGTTKAEIVLSQLSKDLSR
jgi:hypothetical protein